MVLAEKNNENARNGRRSRGPSPNGHVAAESTSEDESVPVDKIRVGRDYQAVCPALQAPELRRPDQLADRALLVWSPTVDIPEDKLDQYISLAKEKYGYNGEQALGMLFWHKHDLERAVLDLANFTPFPDEWSVEDKVLFEQAFQFHGKSFHRIRQMLPDKSIASLVKYYYSWKKTRTRTSLMDKQARKLQAPRDENVSEGGSEGGGSNEESDPEEKKWTIHRGIRRKSGSPPAPGQSTDDSANQGEGGACGNCGVACSLTHMSPKGPLCLSCFQHWRRTGVARPTSGPGAAGSRRGGGGAGARHKRRPPRGMHINHDDLVAMAAVPHGSLILRAMDREIVSLKRQVQHNKQSLSSLKQKTNEGIAELRPETDTSGRINSRWTQDELLLAVQGVRKYGKDFKSIAEVLGTKTEAHVRSFFVNYRRRYNLDDIIKDYESEHGIVNANTESNTEEKMEVDTAETPEAMDVVESADTTSIPAATSGSVPVSKGSISKTNLVAQSTN